MYDRPPQSPLPVNEQVFVDFAGGPKYAGKAIDQPGCFAKIGSSEGECGDAAVVAEKIVHKAKVACPTVDRGSDPQACVRDCRQPLRCGQKRERVRADHQSHERGTQRRARTHP